MKNHLAWLIPLIALSSCLQQGVSLKTDYVEIAIGQDGSIHNLTDLRNGRNYVVDTVPAPLLSLEVDGELIPPRKMKTRDEDLLILFYENDEEAHVQYRLHPTHISFELKKVIAGSEAALVVWGPYPTTIGKSIGETVGIARGEEFALGIQALNAKTLGGYPWHENDCMPQLDIFENEDYSDLSEEGKRYVLYRVEAARPADFGSTLQAYCRNRSQSRTIENWGYKTYEAPPFDDGGVIGSSIALFGCPVDSTLDILGKIELAEGLPHPMLDGTWAKKARGASSAYMILGFGEEDLDKAISYTQKAGLKYLYHPGPFKSWGHFPLNEQFPNGWAGLKACVEKAEGQGIKLGVHTLSNFISTNDPYVSPVPDKRLARVGSTRLTKAIDDGQQELVIDSPQLFAAAAASKLKTLRVDEELIRFETISQEQPWTLRGCIRGAFGTRSTTHGSGAEVELLADHAYQVFLSDAELTLEIAETLARLFNETGIRQISFDGLEGNRSTALGNYGEILMTSTWYENLNEEIRSHYIADASRTSHYFWHIYTRMNWGEPWYAGFRESQAEYRFKNQKYFERNLMPGMLGWFLMTSETNPEDIEWMLAKAAGYDAGFGFVCSYAALEENGFADQILQHIRCWEEARMQGVFDEPVREQLRDVANEFHLEKTGAASWELTSIQTVSSNHDKKERQPGEPSFSQLTLTIPASRIPLGFIITALDGPVKDVRISINNREELLFTGTLQPGDAIKYNGGERVAMFNKQWKKIKEWKVDPQLLDAGDHIFTIDSEPIEGSDSKLKLEIRLPVAKKEIHSNQ